MTRRPSLAPLARTEDWPRLVALLKDMSAEAQDRADQIRALDSPEEDQRRAVAAAVAGAYAFAAAMIEITEKPRQP